MYENILHKPLVLRPGISLTAWSILEELLEKDRQSRLGAREDFVCNVLIYHALLHLKGHHQIHVRSTGLIVGDRDCSVMSVSVFLLFISLLKTPVWSIPES